MAKVFHNAIQSIRQNKLRSFLAGFGIAWGIFLLVIFLGIGNGFKDGIMSLFSAYAQKSLFVYGGQTSVSTPQTNEDTRILFDNGIISDIRKRYPSVISCSPEMSLSGVSIIRDDETVISSISGVETDYFNIKILKVKEGRSITRSDIHNGRNVAVIGEGIKQTLFEKTDAIGENINADGVLFKVVGILASDDLFSMQERNSVYIPSTSFVANFDSSGELASFCLSLSESASSSEIEKDLKGYLAFKYGFDPHDDNALLISNIETQTQAFESLFHGLEILIWIIGICLLLSGIVGVCNVMLIIVKERTNEIGIRKAVGATSGSIISMIMAESVTITVLAGIVGVVLGSSIVLLGDKLILPMLDSELIRSLEINIPAVIAAFVVLSLCGILAGLFPALKASQITPVDAIRYENRD